MKRRLATLTLCLGLFGLYSLPLMAMDQDIASALSSIQARWAEIHYKMPEAQQEKALAALGSEVDTLIARYPNAAELQVWAGIVRSTQAGVHGGLGALKLVKQARRHLEASLTLDPRALDGSAYTSLGALYYQVPGWPLGFGDDDKAAMYLKRALNINPDGLDALYFWGDYLHEQGHDAQARQALEKALQAPPRAGRELADAGRREEIRRLLGRLESE